MGVCSKKCASQEVSPPTSSEDKVAHNRHCKAMQTEYAKVHSNVALGAQLMQLTYAGRRQEVKSERPVKEIVERYPFLQNYVEVMFIYYI